jgi:hypothetical protein
MTRAGDDGGSKSDGDAEFLSLRDGPGATPAQVKFIEDLIEQTGEDLDSWLAVHSSRDELEDLTVEEASNLIDDLVEIRDEMRKDR